MDLLMKNLVILKCLLLTMLFSNAFANQDCPDLNGKYIINGKNDVFTDFSNLLKYNNNNRYFTYGEVEIKGNSNEKLLFILKVEKNEVIEESSNELQFKKDYKCNDGTITFNEKVKTNRNNLPGLYNGKSSITLSKEDLYGGLKVDSVFKGYEDITLYSYDSANLSFSKWWGKKTVVENIILSTAPNKVIKPQINKESQSVIKVRDILNSKVLGGIMLIALEEQSNDVLVTLKAFKSDDLKGFENRLNDSSIKYKMKTEPIWSNNSYFLELLVNVK